MSYLRLGLCVVGVYSMFLLWAIAQERLSVPFQSLDGQRSERFKSSLIISTFQSILGALTSFLYIMARRKPGQTVSAALGLANDRIPSEKKAVGNGKAHTNGHAHHHAHAPTPEERKALMWRYFQCAVFVTAAAPFGFAALSYISYPAMVLGKSCKLIPVMLMNILLYRRRFAPHKYLVVFMVTLGITMFMYYGDDKGKKGKHGGGGSGGNAMLGIVYLLINLAIDGATNSTQDEVFSRYKVTGQQMMFFINCFSTLITLVLAALPLPVIPVIHPTPGNRSELATALEFVRTHRGVVRPLVQFALTGALGQLFIFETLQHFGSLALVTITLTRKMFTMLLSVFVYNHKLTSGQWLGAGVVFAGISVEAMVKRRDVHAKRVLQEKERAEIKTL